MEELNTLQREPDDSFDRVLRTELHWTAPEDLTTTLLALVPGAPVARPAAYTIAAPAPRPQSWYTWAVVVLTAVALGLSFAIAWQFYMSLYAGLGLAAVWAQIQAAPALGLQQVYDTLPASRYIIALVIGIRDQLHWLLLAAVLWLALDGWSPRVFSRRRQQTS